MRSSAEPATHLASFIAESGQAGPPPELSGVRPGMPLQLRSLPGHLLIDVETLDGHRMGCLPREDALRLQSSGVVAERATVTALMPALGRTRVMIRVEIAQA